MSNSEMKVKEAMTASAAATAQEWFGRFARVTASASGKPVAFLAATGVVILWAATGPLFGYSDTWQLVINTGTTIVTFLMVFLIQNTQNRDTMAVQLKLAEIILAMKGAENRLALAEDLSDEELERLHEECRQRADATLVSLTARRSMRGIDKDPKTLQGAAAQTMQAARAAKAGS
jgi:low affinity Fe/Cu permease